MPRQPMVVLVEDVCEQISRDGADGISKVLEIPTRAAMFQND